MMFRRVRDWLFPPKMEEKETIVAQIATQNERLNVALDGLAVEMRGVKSDKVRRDAMTQMFDDAVDALANKKARK